MHEEMFAATNFTTKPFMNGQNGRLQTVGWLVGWLTCACAH